MRYKSGFYIRCSLFIKFKMRKNEKKKNHNITHKTVWLGFCSLYGFSKKDVTHHVTQSIYIQCNRNTEVLYT